MRKVCRRPDQSAGSDLALLIAYHHPRLSREDEIKFVGPGVDVGALRLPGLKTVQPDKQVLARYDVDLGRFLFAEDGQSIE